MDGIGVTVTVSGFTISGNQTATDASIANKVSKTGGDSMSGDYTLSSGSNFLAEVSGTNDIGTEALPYGNGHFVNLFCYTAPAGDFDVVNKAYIDSLGIGTNNLEIKEAGASVTGTTAFIDFTHALDVAISTSGVTVAVDEDELDPAKVVMATGTQNIGGAKTFTSVITIFSGAEPAFDDTGAPGEARWAGNYIYLCVATDTWRRIPLSDYSA